MTSIINEDAGRYCFLCLFLCLMLSFLCVSTSAQDVSSQTASSAEEPTTEIPTAAVKVDGETLFTVRGVSALPAEKRAQMIADRIKDVAQDRLFDIQNLQLIEAPSSGQILAGRQAIVTVYDADARLEGVDRQTLGRAYLLRIQETLATYRQARQPRVLVLHTLLALAAALALLGFLFVGLRLVRRTLRELERRYKHRIGEVRIQGLKLLPAERMWGSLIGALKFVTAAAGLVAIYSTLAYLFSLFPWTRGLSYNLAGLVLEPLLSITRKFVATIPDLFFLLVLAGVTYYLLKVIRLAFSSIENGAATIAGFDPAWAKPTYRLIRGFAIALALVVAFPYIPGSNTQAFKGVSLFVGLVFSLGSTSLIGNLVSGYSLTYRRAFKQGDRVKIGDYVGNVQESKLLVTYLRTIKNEIIAVPNSSIVNTEVTNYSSLAHIDGLILHTSVGIGYGTPWRQVEAMLLRAAAQTDGLLREPKPFVREKQLRTFDVEYEINAYCDSPHAVESLYAALHRNILDVFNEYGVQIMTPAYEGDPRQDKVVTKERWYLAPAIPETTEQEKTVEPPPAVTGIG